MDIDVRAPIGIVMREAFNRIDGRAMYLSLLILAVGLVFFLGRNLIVGDFSFGAWMVVWASFLAIPVEVILYFYLGTFSKKGSHASRLFSALCLLFLPFYLYLTIL